MRQFYKNMIIEAIDTCADTDLLELVWKMLLNSPGAPRPAEPTRLEVKTDADYSRDQGLNRAVTIQICRRPEHSHSVDPKVGNRCQSMPSLCGGADSLSCAA